MALRTRPPTGRTAWPIILLDGPPKTGKSCLAYELSASPNVGRTFVFPVGERTADEYGALGPYEIVETSGWADFFDQLVEATKIPMVDGKPNVIIIDTVTGVWSALKDWAATRARNSERARRILAADPDAEIEPATNLWNDAKDRWAHMISLLTGWAGISVLIARGDEVTAFRDGQPQAGQTVYRPEVEKSTPYNVTANVRMLGHRTPALMSASRLDLGIAIPRTGYTLPAEQALHHLLFDLLDTRADTSDVATVTDVAPGRGRSVAAAKQAVLDVYTTAGWDLGPAKAAAGAVWGAHYPAKVHIDEVPEGTLAAMIEAATAEAGATPATTEPAPAPEPAQAAEPGGGKPQHARRKTQQAGSDALAAAAEFVRAHGGNPDDDDDITPIGAVVADAVPPPPSEE